MSYGNEWEVLWIEGMKGVREKKFVANVLCSPPEYASNIRKGLDEGVRIWRG